jgi:hypothetical protein
LPSQKFVIYRFVVVLESWVFEWCRVLQAVDPMPYSGSVDFQLHAENVNKAQNLVVYAFDDEPSSWPSGFN